MERFQGLECPEGGREVSGPEVVAALLAALGEQGHEAVEVGLEEKKTSFA